MTVSKCPNCGARISGGHLSCPECGFVFEMETEASYAIRNSVLELREALLSAKTDEQKIIIIETFSMPSTQQSLIELMEFAYSNFTTSNGHSSAALSKAWLSKARQAYEKVSRDSSRSSDSNPVVERYAFLREGSKDERLKVLASEKKTRRKKIVIALSLIIAFIILLFLFLVVVSHIDEKSLPSLDDRINECISAGDYDSARKAAGEAEYPWEEREYLDQILECEINELVSNGKVEQALLKAAEFDDISLKDDWTQRLQVIMNE